MARAPRSSVPKTSGAGVSRLSYQKAYASNAGKGTRVPKDRLPTTVSADTNSGGGKLRAPSSDNRSNYAKADTPDMGKPSKSLERLPAKKFKSEKDQSGFLKVK